MSVQQSMTGMAVESTIPHPEYASASDASRRAFVADDIYFLAHSGRKSVLRATDRSDLPSTAT